MQDTGAKKKSGCSCGTIIVVVLLIVALVIGLLGFASYKLYHSTVAMLETSTVAESTLKDAWVQTEADLASGLGKNSLLKLTSFFANKDSAESLVVSPSELQLAVAELIKEQLGTKADQFRFSCSASEDVLTVKFSIAVSLLSETVTGQQLLSEDLGKKYFEPEVELQARLRDGHPYLAIRTVSIAANPEFAQKLEDWFAGDNLFSVNQDQSAREYLAQIDSLEIEHGAIRLVKNGEDKK